MDKCVLEYAQPHPSEYDADVVVFEMETASLEEKDVGFFLDADSVVCDCVIQHRRRIGLKPLK